MKHLLVLLGLSILFTGCQTRPPTSPKSGPLTLSGYLAVLNGNGGYLSFVMPASGFVLEGPAVGAIYPQAVRACGSRLVVVNSSGNQLRLYDALTPRVLAGTVQFDPGTNPVDVAFETCDVAYVSCFDANAILKVDLVSRSVAATLAVPPSQGSNPDGLAIASGKLYAGLPGFSDGNRVAVVELASFGFSAGSPVTVGENSQTLLVAGGRIHAVCASGYNPDWSNKMQGSVHIIDPTTDLVERVVDLAGSDPAYGAAAENGRVFLTGWNSGLLCYDAATGAVLRGPGNAIALPPTGGLMGVESRDSRVWTSSFMEDTVLEFDTTTYAPTGSYAVGSQPGALTYVP